MTTGNPATMTAPDAYSVPAAMNESTTPGVFETTLRTTEQQLEMGGGQLANLEVYNGTAPGPTLFLDQDDTVIVRLINKLPHPSGIHWHGIELPNGADGTPVTQNGLVPLGAQTLGTGELAGGTYLYKFTVPRPGLYWYHPHHFHSTNRVFRQTFGMVVVRDPNEATLIANGTLPDASDTYQLVLSDITVCKPVGMNDAATFDSTLPWAGGPSLPSQSGPTPLALCETAPIDEDGNPGVAFNQLDVPNVQQAGRVNEGQTVLTNGVDVGGRAGTPDAPGALDPGAQTTTVPPGQGVRFQVVNTATTRYFRLLLKAETTGGTVTVPLVRIGGEGGLLDNAVIEGGMITGFDTEFDTGEIVLPPASRADVVAVIPTNATGVATMWTLDYQRTGSGGDNFWANIPTVPVMHMTVAGAPTSFTMTDGTPILASVGASVPVLPDPAPGSGFLDPTTFAKDGNPALQINLEPGPMIDGVSGDFSVAPIYTNVPHIGSSRYAALDADLVLTVRNASGAHHPFHLHGFSFQPVALTHPTDPAQNYVWPYNEFRDNVDIPNSYTLTAKVHFEERSWHDGVTLGGSFGRWLFHCHIFHHAHKGMISELVVTSPAGTEKPDINVGGSWCYAPIPGTAERSGRFSHPDGLAVGPPVAHLADGTLIGNIATTGDRWDWTLDTTAMSPMADLVYVTVTDPGGRASQTVFRLKVGGPDDGSDNGDPHIHTVDGQRYDFQAAGEFVLLRDSDGLEIQTRQTPVPSQNPISDSYTGLKVCVSVNTAFAARVGDHTIVYQPGVEPGQLDFFVDGKLSKLPERGLQLGPHRVSTFDAEGATGLRVDYAHQAVVQVTPRFWTSHSISYMNIKASNVEGIEGLIGPIAAGSWLPALPSGATVGPRPRDLRERFVQLYQIFGNAWRVTGRSSMFVYRPDTTTETFTDRDWPSEQPPCSVKSGLEIPGAPVLNGMPVAAAEQICAFLTDDGLRQDCVFDVAVTGDESFAAGYRFAEELSSKSTAVRVDVEERDDGDGRKVTILVAKVRLLSGGPATGGTVAFWDGGTRLSPDIPVGAGGTARWEPGDEAAGDRTIHAEYTDVDGGTFTSVSPGVDVSVVPGHGPTPPSGLMPPLWWLWLLIFVVIVVLVWLL